MAFNIKKWRKNAISMYGTARGLTAAQRLKVTTKTHGKAPSKATTKSPAKTRVKKIASKKKKKRAKAKFTLPLALVLPIVASPFMRPHPDFGSPAEHFRNKNWEKVLTHLLFSWTGYWCGDNEVPQARFDFMKGGSALKATLVGGAIHWLAGKIGVNRYLGRAKVPVIRV